MTMVNRERVIWSLEMGITTTEMIGGEFVYITKDEARKALELLKEQEARVLTKDEANEAEVTWLEVRGHEPYATLDANTFKPESYGKYYRCWNYKPTDEQRKAVKWNATY